MSIKNNKTRVITILLGVLTTLTFTSSTYSASASTTAPATAPDISGSYNCSYHDPYAADVNSTEKLVFKKDGDTYKIQEIAKDAAIPYAVGTGLFNKDLNNAFVFLYWLPSAPDNTAIKFFIIKSDGSLDGVLVGKNTTTSGTETCTKA